MSEHVWVVEMWHDGRWNPTVAVSPSRSDGRIEMSGWKVCNPDDKFRLTRYNRPMKARMSR